MRRFGIIFSAVVASCTNQTQPAISSNEYDPTYVQALMSVCVRDYDNRERVQAAAKAMDWKLIEDPEVRKMLAPGSGNDKWVGWAFQHDQKKFMLLLTDAEHNGSAKKICTLIGEPSDIPATSEHLIELLNAKKIDDESEGGQSMAIYSFAFEGQQLVLSIMDARQMGMSMMHTSVMSDLET